MPPPYDRTIALACTMGTLHHRYLTTACRCGNTTPHPIKLMISEREVRPEQTLADAVVLVRCTICHQRGQMPAWLCETVYCPDGKHLTPSQRPGWAILLHECAPEHLPSAQTEAAA